MANNEWLLVLSILKSFRYKSFDTEIYLVEL